MIYDMQIEEWKYRAYTLSLKHKIIPVLSASLEQRIILVLLLTILVLLQ